MTKMQKVARNRRLNQLALTTALSGMSIFGYGRSAYAGGCAVTGTPGTYLCSGPADATTDVVVFETGSPLNVLLAPGFGIDTSISAANGEFLYGPGWGNGLSLIGYGGLTINDQGGSASVIGAYDGVVAINDFHTSAGDNSLLITASGTSFEGVYTGLVAQNFGTSTNGASNLEITTGDVTGALALSAVNFGIGAADSNLTINTVAGTVTGGSVSGIYAKNYGWSYGGHSDFTVTTADVSSAGRYVINLTNFADAELSGDVTLDTSGGHIDGTGPNSIGIVVRNLGTAVNGTSNVTITTASVTATSTGMYIQNRSETDYTDTSGDTNVIVDTTAGSVVATTRSGIAVTNQGVSDLGSSDLSINTSDVSGGLWGINALNEGSAYDSTNLTIDSAKGTVSATSATGIAVYAINRGESAYSTSDLSITTADVTGAFGIYARNYGAGALGSNLRVDTTAGKVTADSGDGLYAVNYGVSASGAADLSVTTGDVTSGGNGMDARNYGVGKNGSDLTIDTTAGRISSVTGRTADGIYALNKGFSAAGSSDLTITTGDISANFFGISATNYGDSGSSSNLVIDTTAGSVIINPEATDGRDGISVSNFGYSFQGTSDVSIATADVTGALNGIYATNFSEGYAYAEGFSGASMLIDTSAGTVEGTLGNGIQARHRGISGDGYADLSITTANVTGGKYGIKAFAKADGYAGASVFIDTTAGTVTGLGEDGIEARNEGESAYGATDLIITTADVTGAEYGIFARNEADGYLGANLIIDTSDGAVEGKNRDGINVKNRGITTDSYQGLEITADLVITTGKVTGHGYGIYARNYAEGYSGSNVIINSRGSVTGTNEDGIYATNAGISADGRADLSITTNAVSGATHGIFARNDAYGFYGSTLTIDSRLGAVTGDSRDGIDVRHSGEAVLGSTDMLITTAGVTGKEHGIRARSNSSGSSGASLIINTVFGSVEGKTLDGIYADLRSRSGIEYSDLSITTAAVTGGNFGIFARNNSYGFYGSSLVIDTVAGSVEGKTEHGIYADLQSQSRLGYSDLRIATAAVTGGNFGIFARNTSDGWRGSSVIINTTGGNVEGKNGTGIYATTLGYSDFGYSHLSVTTVDVTGAINGIEVKGGSGGYWGSDVTINSTAGSVVGTAGVGIRAISENSAYLGTTNLSITTADVEGAVGGIYAKNKSDGVFGSLLSIDTSLGETPGTVRGGYGIRAFNESTSDEGAATLTVRTADVTATTGDGVFARNAATSELDANVIVNTTAGAVNAISRGVYAVAAGASASGNIDVTITTQDVTSVGNAVLGGLNGTSETDANITIDTTAGDIVSLTGKGIYSLVGSGVRTNGSSDITITTGDVRADEDTAVLAAVNGTSETGANIMIDTTAGDIVSTNNNGINAQVYGIRALVLSGARTNGSSDITIATGDVMAEETAILAFMNGRSEAGANMTINTTAGDIVSTTSRGVYGLVANGLSTNGNSDITITTGNVTASDTAIRAEFADGGFGRGSKKITIDTTEGIITSNEYIGIAAVRRSGSGDITITTGDVHGDENGIYVFSQFGGNESSNVIVDTTAGTVTRGGTFRSAINVVTNVVESNLGSTDMRITTADVEGVTFVNNSRAELTADVVIDTTSGSVTAYGVNFGANGIIGRNNSITRQGSANLTITTADVTSNNAAIIVENRSWSMGSANLTIDTLAGHIVSTERTGIFADNGQFSYRNISLSGSTHLQITTADVTGALDGIFAHNRGESATGSNLIIDSTAGLVIGLGGVGIYASNSGSALAGTTDLTLTVGSVIGRTHGVHAVQNTDGDLTFRSNDGGVGGYLGYGLNALNNGMGATDIALTNSGIFGNVAGVFVDHGTSTGAFTIDVGDLATIGNTSGLTSDLAIRARSEVTGLTLTNQAGGSIDGTLDLTSQDDVFNNAGTWDTSGGVNDFGGGNDVVNNTSLQTLVVGNGVANQVTFMNNLELFNNTGRVTFVDGFASDTLVLSGNFDGTGGVMAMEFDATTLASDLLVVNGDVVGGPTTVVLSAIGGAGGLTGTGQNDGISLVQVAGTTSAADFQLAGAAQVDVFLYDALSLGSDNVWRLQSAFLPTINGYEVYPSALLNMTKLAPYRDRRGARQVSMGQNGTEAWLQMGGTWLERDQEGSASGTSFEQNINEITAGVDFVTQGAITAGVNLRFSEGSTLMDGPSGASKIKTEGYGIGASLTWHGADGVYVDTQASYMSFTSDLLGNANNSGQGIAASVEVGRSFTLPSDGWSMTHRAQLSYSVVDFDTMLGSFGETVRLRDGESLTGRFGLALNRDWSGASGAANSLFGAVDLVHELMPDTAVDVTVLNTTTFARSAAPTRIEFGLGGKIGLSETSHLYGALNASQDLGGSDSPQLSASFGFNMRW